MLILDLPLEIFREILFISVLSQVSHRQWRRLPQAPSSNAGPKLIFAKDYIGPLRLRLVNRIFGQSTNEAIFRSLLVSGVIKPYHLPPLIVSWAPAWASFVTSYLASHFHREDERECDSGQERAASDQAGQIQGSSAEVDGARALVTAFGGWAAVPSPIDFAGRKPTNRPQHFFNHQHGKATVVELPDADVEENEASTATHGLHLYGPLDLPNNPLVAAVEGGNKEIVKLLIFHGADPNAHPETDTPLMAAVHKQDIEMAKILLDAGADVDVGQPPPIALAVRAGDKAMFQSLRRWGAILDTPETGGWAMTFAQSMGMGSMVELLVSEGVEEDALWYQVPTRDARLEYNFKLSDYAAVTV